jgi:hypothetical protein
MLNEKHVNCAINQVQSEHSTDIRPSTVIQQKKECTATVLH